MAREKGKDVLFSSDSLFFSDLRWVVNTTFPCSPSFPQGCYQGDISGKFGTLPNAPAVFVDDRLTLIGAGSIIGHGIYFLRPYNVWPQTNQEAPFACSNVVLTSTPRMKYAVATFPEESLVRGQIVFEQPLGYPDAQVTIQSSLYYNTNLNISVPPTFYGFQKVKYQVHFKPVEEGDSIATTPNEERCLSTGGLISPILQRLESTKAVEEARRLCRLANL